MPLSGVFTTHDGSNTRWQMFQNQSAGYTDPAGEGGGVGFGRGWVRHCIHENIPSTKVEAIASEMMARAAMGRA